MRQWRGRRWRRRVASERPCSQTMETWRQHGAYLKVFQSRSARRHDRPLLCPRHGLSCGARLWPCRPRRRRCPGPRWHVSFEEGQARGDVLTGRRVVAVRHVELLGDGVRTYDGYAYSSKIYFMAIEHLKDGVHRRLQAVRRQPRTLPLRQRALHGRAPRTALRVARNMAVGLEVACRQQRRPHRARVVGAEGGTLGEVERRHHPWRADQRLHLWLARPRRLQ
eukprot:scaffold65608_cov71-Phaeocystis_antarctica.AAC.5